MPKSWQCVDCLGRAHGKLRDGTALCYTCGGKRADRIRDLLTAEGIRKQPYGDAWHCIWGHPNKWPEGIPPSIIADEAELPKSRVLKLIAASAPKEESCDRSTCAWCEYFDGGGLALVEAARATGKIVHGDCHNSASDRFTTDSIDTCPAFHMDSTLKETKDGRALSAS